MVTDNVFTVPFCGSCGWKIGGGYPNRDGDTFCDACGADLRVFGFTDGPANATGATAGEPGSFTPTGSIVPPTAVSVVDGVVPILADPQTPWTANQYVECGDASICHWNGTAWAYDSAS